MHMSKTGEPSELHLTEHNPYTPPHTFWHGKFPAVACADALQQHNANSYTASPNQGQ